MTKFYSILFITLLTAFSLADTPPPGASVLKGGTDGTKIGNISDALKVNLTNSITATAYQGGSWTVAGNMGRTWTLSNTDIVTAVQSGVWNINLPTNAATASAQTTGNASLSSIDGKITTTVNGIKVDASGITIPAGISTSANQATEITALQNIDTSTSLGAKESGGHLASVDSKMVTTANGIKVDGSSAIQPVSMSTLPLPSGASTVAAQNTGNASLSSLDNKTPVLGQALSSGSTPVVLPAAQISALTPLSTVTANLGTLNGAATSAKQDTGNSYLASIDTKLTAPISITGAISATNPSVGTNGAAAPSSSTEIGLINGSGNLVGVSSSNPLPITGSISASNPSVGLTGSSVPGSATMVAGSDGTNLKALKVSSAGILSVDNSSVTQPISASSLPLPTGSSTSALQTTGNASLSSLDSKSPSLGQALAAASIPVVLPSAQISTLTPLSSVGVNNFPSSQAVTGTVTATQSTGANLHVNVDSMPTTSVSGTVTANLGTLNGAALDSSVTAMSAKLPTALDGSGFLKVHEQGTVPVTGTFYQATQPISGSVSVSSIPAITGTVTANAGTNLNTSSLALESGGHLASLDTKSPSLGQALAASSVPVVLTAAQLSTLTPLTSIGVNNFPATQPVSATALPLPSGASTSALQSSMITAIGTPMQQTGGSVTANAGTNLNTSALNLEATQSAMNAKFTTTANGIKVDGSAVTQPVSGTVTSNIGTTNGLALDSTLTGGTQKAITRGGSKGTTAAADITSTASGANHQPVDVAIYDASGAQITSFGGGTQYSEGTTNASPTGTTAMGRNPSNVLKTLALDSSGNLNVNLAAGSISGGNGAASPTGSAVPVQADYLGINVGGNLVGVSSSNPIPVNETGPSDVGVVGSTTPLNAAYIAGSDGTNLRGANVIPDGNGGYAIQVAQAATGYQADPGNTSTVQLAASATFTGSITGVINQQSYSILLTSDQPGTLTINQYIDGGGTRNIQTLTYPIAANVGFARSGVINGNFIKLSFQNTGASTTTTFNLNTYYGTIPAATQLNNSPEALNEVNGSPISLGQTVKASSLPVTIASDQTSIPTYSSSTVDSSIANLAASATYTTPWFDTSTGGSQAAIFFIADQPITYVIQVSPDQTNIKTLDTAAIPISTNYSESHIVTTRYWRATYQNTGASATTSVLFSTAQRVGSQPESIRVSDKFGNDLVMKAASTAALATDGSAVVALSPNSPVPLPTITKGTQGTTGATVQQLKDAGRNITNYFQAAQVVSTATDTLQSLTGYKSGAAVTATTTPAVVTTGKTYRVQKITITYIAIATIGAIQVSLRANTAGVVAIGSPVVASHLVGASSATAGNTNTVEMQIPDGLEFAAGTGIGISVLGVGATGTASAVGYSKVTIYGYEY